MNDSTAARIIATAGDIVIARPWADGREIAARRGLVLSVDGDYLVVWFRQMGPLCSAESGRAVQAILPGKAEVVGHVAGYAPASQVRLGQIVRKSGYAAAAPLYRVLLRVIAAAA